MARGDTGWDSHVHEARIEDARFLLDEGEPIDLVAKRLGMTVKALERALARDKERHAPRT